MITIGIAEDQALVRESLAIVLDLEPDLQVRWTAATGRIAMDTAQSDPVDVVLMDLRMPELDGVTAMKHLRALEVQSTFIVLTTFHQDEWVLDALNAGAKAVFLKETPPALLVRAIRSILSDKWDVESWSTEWRNYAPQIQFQTKFTAYTEGLDSTLTKRDLDVIRKICAGMTNLEIAESLHLSEGTVKNYVSSLYSKLGVRHRAEAIRIARERGF